MGGNLQPGSHHTVYTVTGNSVDGKKTLFTTASRLRCSEFVTRVKTLLAKWLQIHLNNSFAALKAFSPLTAIKKGTSSKLFSGHQELQTRSIMKFYICKNFPQAEKICDVCKVHGKSMSGSASGGNSSEHNLWAA